MFSIARLILLFFLVTEISEAQNPFNGFTSIFIPNQPFFDKVKDDSTEIANYTITCFRATGYTLYSNFKELPQEILDNKCELLSSYVNYDHKTETDPNGNTHNYFIVRFRILDCHDSLLTTVESAAEYFNSWGYTYKKAIRELSNKLTRRYKYDPSKKTPGVVPFFQTLEMTNETEETLSAYFNENKLDPIEGMYETGVQTKTVTYYKFGIKKFGKEYYKLIIIKSEFPGWKQGEVKAYLRSDTTNAVMFPSTWYLGNKVMVHVVCEFEQGVLIFPTPTIPTDKKRITNTFRKLFPIAPPSNTK
jgi:hypothetical protein